MRVPVCRRLLAPFTVLVCGFFLLLPDFAAAHGRGTPSATDFAARITREPAWLQASVVDGDIRLWLKVPARRTVIVMDTTGAPFLRFSAAGVAVNLNSSMYYLSQNPPLTPPRGITETTPPRWSKVSGGHSYRWVDPRLQALDVVARTPGAAHVGTWRIPLLVGDHRTAITGTLDYRGPPPLVWFWPIVVLLICLPAGLRLRRRELDLRVARRIAGATLLAVSVGAVARGLHGRPSLSLSALLLAVVILALAGIGARLVRTGSGEVLTYVLVAVGGLAEGITMLPTLFHGYVLLALPGFLVRAATVACLCGGAGLIMMLATIARAFRSDAAQEAAEAEELAHALP